MEFHFAWYDHGLSIRKKNVAQWFGYLSNPSLVMILLLLFTFRQQQTLSFSFSRVTSLVLSHLYHQDLWKQNKMEQNNLWTHQHSYLKKPSFTTKAHSLSKKFSTMIPFSKNEDRAELLTQWMDFTCNSQIQTSLILLFRVGTDAPRGYWGPRMPHLFTWYLVFNGFINSISFCPTAIVGYTISIQKIIFLLLYSSFNGCINSISVCPAGIAGNSWHDLPFVA